MALTSVLLLVALASSAIAQTSNSPIIPDPTTTTMVMMTSTQVPVETSTPAPVVANVSADEIQRQHFFVSTVDQNATSFSG